MLRPERAPIRRKKPAARPARIPDAGIRPATEEQPPLDAAGLREHLRKEFLNKPGHQGGKGEKILIADLKRDLKHGWMMPFLLPAESVTWGRWNYWGACQASGRFPIEPIPQISFEKHYYPQTMIGRCLDAIPNQGRDSWRDWGSFTYFRYLLDWLLFGLGHAGQLEMPEEPNGRTGAAMRLYQLWQPEAMLLWPFDYLGDMMAEMRCGQRRGFVPVPHEVAQEMVPTSIVSLGDWRTRSVCDPAACTGRMLLHASNFSMRLYGQDIDEMLCKVTLVNGYLYAPWLAIPITWLDPAAAAACDPDISDVERCAAWMAAAAMSEQATYLAPPHQQEYLADTEFSPEDFRHTAPILIRKARSRTFVSRATQQSIAQVGRDPQFRRPSRKERRQHLNRQLA